MTKKIDISIHAIERFAERVFNMPSKAVESLTTKQRIHISNLIEEALFDHGDIVTKMGEGVYKNEDYGIMIIVRDFKVTTIKVMDPEDEFERQFKGGRMRKERREATIKAFNKREQIRKEIKNDKRRS